MAARFAPKPPAAPVVIRPKTIARREIHYAALIGEAPAVKRGGRRMRWDGFTWIDEGELRGDEIELIEPSGRRGP